MSVFGVILLVAAAVTIVFHVLAKKKIAAILVAREASISALKAQHEAVTAELGEEGGFEEMVTLRGGVACEAPITSPLAEAPCLYFSMKISRKSEETVERRNAEGEIRLERQTHTETMSTESRHCAFELVDGEDRLPVRLEGASYDRLTQTMDRFDPGEDTGLLSRFNVAFNGGYGQRRTLGYRYEEDILPLDQELTVVGLVKADKRGLSIGHGGLAFIVSPRLRTELLGTAQKTAQYTAIGSGIAAALGVALTVLGALS
ncbi:E3 ubiquitin ligase family protein [Myxococcota bacterium]|nr:E3 ubiquitin ligase family protein [Myxococcota bacterium]